MQCDGFFRRFTFTLGRRHHDQQFFTGDLFEFIVASVHQFHVQLRGLQIVAQRFGNPTRVAGLRSGNQGDGRRFYRLSGRAYHGAGLLIQHAPEVAGHPSQLGWRKVSRGRL